MPEKIKELIPFMMAGATSIGTNTSIRININRMVEAAIIAIVTGGMTMYGVTIVLKTQMVDMQAQIIKIDKDHGDAMNVLRNDICNLRSMFEQHLLHDDSRFLGKGFNK